MANAVKPTAAIDVGVEVTVVDGIVIVVDQVDLYDAHLIVRLSAVPDTQTRRLTAEWLTAIEEWSDADGAGSPPAYPEAAVFRRIDVTVVDPSATAYRLRRTSVGGVGSEWRACWAFTPAPPRTAKTLTVTVAGDQSEPSDVSVALPVARWMNPQPG